MNKVRVCVIGCGRAGMIHVRNFAGAVKNAELAALFGAADALAEDGQVG